ncbi:MAG: 1-acyl-sn-glycerol-3-phosphate acyltransferase [Acidobacteria bacterium]|nr:1-acyl-sn-glycerol-3-phosphate acyltransferase [Acidobacteriota bacterium]
MTRAPLTAKLRGWAVVSFWALSLLVMGVPALILYVFVRNSKVIFSPTRFGCWLGFKLGGIKFIVQGLEKLQPDQAYIFVANHQSLLDPPAMLVYLKRDFGFLAKKELFRLPVFNPGLYWIDCVPIDRSNREAAIRSTQRAAEKIRRGRSIIAYPEGTRSPDGKMRPFKRGAFHMALESGAAIVPVTLDGTYELMPKGPICIFPGTAHITVHDPLDVTAYCTETVGELAETAYRIIDSALRDSRAATHGH